MIHRMVAAVVAAWVMLASCPAAAADDWQLVWADEFDGPAIDPARWSFDVDCWGGGNGERQCYTAARRNAAIIDGKLIITARQEHASGPALPMALRKTATERPVEVTRDFTSARLTTRAKAAWRYGRIEIRARLPQGQGLWPAIWMLPEQDSYGPWAASGEIDILEAVNLGVRCVACPGGREDRILGTLHFGGKWPGNVHAGSEFHFPDGLQGFHNYALEWQPDRMVWLVDGHTYAERKRSEWWTSGSGAAGAPFDRAFHLIINLAVGGGLAEGRDAGGVANGGFPKRFEIDWVRVWQKAGERANPASAQSGAGGK